MGLAEQQRWRHDTSQPGFPFGSPLILATPLAIWRGTLMGHGYRVDFYPDVSHQVANPPEDHCPYSETPWPGEQPYPYCDAIDFYPHADPKMPTLAQIGAQVTADKQAGVAGVAWLKYQNWTDANDACWHDSWQPSFSRRSSSDRGHNHNSVRTDYVKSNVALGYDPIARIMNGGRKMSVVIYCPENGGYYSYPVPKWFRSAQAAQAAAAAYGSTIVTVQKLADIRAQFGYIPGDAAAVATGRADVVADANGNVLPTTVTPVTGVTVAQATAIARSEIGRSTNTPGT